MSTSTVRRYHNRNNRQQKLPYYKLREVQCSFCRGLAWCKCLRRRKRYPGVAHVPAFACPTCYAKLREVAV
jgi:hypothetical protein